MSRNFSRPGAQGIATRWNNSLPLYINSCIELRSVVWLESGPDTRCRQPLLSTKFTYGWLTVNEFVGRTERTLWRFLRN